MPTLPIPLDRPVALPEPPVRRSKYRPLYDYLKRRSEDELVMSLHAVEIVLKGMLPNASRLSSWWSAPEGGHAGALSWTAAGFSAELDPRGEQVRFARQRASAGREARLFA